MTEETADLSAPAKEPVDAPEPVSVPKTPGAGRTRRATGLLGQVVGIVGMVVCLALVVGVLFGRGWATNAVTDVAGTLDATLARADPLLATALTGIDAVAQKAGEAATAAEALAVDPNATPEALQAVVARLGAVSERYLELRGTYAGAREQVVSALDRLAVVDRFVPGVSVPQGPIDALASLDEKARSLDASVVGLINAGTAVQAANTTAKVIAERARAVETGTNEVAAALTDVQARLASVHTEVASITDTVNGLITVVVIVLIVVLLYLTLLHLVLFRSSRGHGRAPAA